MCEKCSTGFVREKWVQKGVAHSTVKCQCNQNKCREMVLKDVLQGVEILGGCQTGLVLSQMQKVPL